MLSAVIKREPPLHLVPRRARTAPSHQCTTAITLGELLYGLPRELIASAGLILPFDESAAQRYGALRAGLEAEGHRLAEPDLRIAATALSRDATLVTGNVRHFTRVPSCGSKTGSSRRPEPT